VREVIRRGTGRWWHWCPACQRAHPLPDRGWLFNGDTERPTFDHSFRQSYYDRERRSLVECHYHVVDGKLQFCIDSWHKRSDIIAMPTLPTDLVLEDPDFRP
jgi:hypothetical protein